MSFPKIEGYVVTERLGAGSYATVYKACTKTGARSTVAIKCVDKARVKNSGTAVDNLITEIRLLKTLRHPHIVHMHDFLWDERNIYIITEYCCGGDLARRIRSHGRLPERQVRYFLQQLVSALKFMWEKGVMHMDLKPHNLLLQRESGVHYTLKVADFGFATYVSAAASQGIRGSLLYMAPEVVRGRPGPHADLWSVGVILYECLFGRAPYASASVHELMEKINAQVPIEIPPRSHISSGCQDLLTRLLQHDPTKRITHQELFVHEYLDLDHMPTKENFDKGVALVRAGVERERRHDWASALEAYREGLRYLVPAVEARADAAQRAALRAKVTGYMERAEQLQAFLRTDGAAPVPPAPADDTGVPDEAGQPDEHGDEVVQDVPEPESTPARAADGGGTRGPRAWLRRTVSNDDVRGEPAERLSSDVTDAFTRPVRSRRLMPSENLCISPLDGAAVLQFFIVVLNDHGVRSKLNRNNKYMLTHSAPALTAVERL
ncbi:hypothetical protein EVAR_92995_1 [Eumeta japonica]|uniref:Serine/threonine-protein kinase ULK3 n=1 Tax=Eumeta variegata TaxID=151549 RepID=A0A4C1TAI3_EUMVA|nr:hypothetical protein EVAR_92995_1 [Eumeta japonica]